MQSSRDILEMLERVAAALRPATPDRRPAPPYPATVLPDHLDRACDELRIEDPVLLCRVAGNRLHILTATSDYHWPPKSARK